MIRSTPISAHLSKVNQELEKLANIIKNDQRVYDMTKQALLQCSPSQFSDNSLELLNQSIDASDSKGFLKLNDLPHNPSPRNFQTNPPYASTQQGYAHGHLLSTQSQASTFMGKQQIESQADITLKKFRPIKHHRKKNEENLFTLVEKDSRLIKAAKSENKIKKDSSKKSKVNEKIKKKEKKNISNISTQFKKIKPKTKLNCTKTASSQQRLHQSMKMQINLKKQVVLKITDLKIKKQLCQRESEYLSHAMKINQFFFESLKQDFNLSSDESLIRILMVKILIKFFSQFITEQWLEELSTNKMIEILENPHILIKAILKLPDLLKKNSTLCKQRCSELFEHVYILENKAETKKQIQKDQLYIYIQHLYGYISFLLNNSMVHETKRRFLQRNDFITQRSADNKKINNQIQQSDKKQEAKEYDSDRKHLNKRIGKSQESALKRMNTHKILSPKQKFKKK